MGYFWAALRYYAVFKGRTNLKAFWIYQLIITLVTSLCWIIPLIYVIHQASTSTQHLDMQMYSEHRFAFQLVSLSENLNLHMPLILQWLNNFGTLFFLITFIPTLAICARRLHDSDHAATWLWLLCVPLIGFIVIIIFLTFESTPGDNRYGSNPNDAPDGTIIELS